MRPTRQLHDLGQSLWLDNITRASLDNGTLRVLRVRNSITEGGGAKKGKFCCALAQLTRCR
jgi:hypothetical protein